MSASSEHIAPSMPSPRVLEFLSLGLRDCMCTRPGICVRVSHCCLRVVCLRVVCLRVVQVALETQASELRTDFADRLETELTDAAARARAEEAAKLGYVSLAHSAVQICQTKIASHC